MKKYEYINFYLYNQNVNKKPKISPIIIYIYENYELNHS